MGKPWAWMRPGSALVFSVVGFILLPGCLGGQGFGVTDINDPTEVPADAPSLIGKGDERLTVRVRLGSGAGNGSARTPVLVYHITDPVDAPTPPMLLRQNATFVGRTDERGEITVRVVRGEYYSIFAFNPNYTTEVQHRLRMSADVLQAPRNIVLYPITLDVTFTGTVPLTPANVGIPIYRKGVDGYYPAYFPQALRFAADPAVDKSLHRRLVDLQGQMIVDSPAPPEFGARLQFTDSYTIDEPSYNIPQPSTHRFAVRASEYRYAMDLPKSNPRIGLLLLGPQLNPAGLPYTIQVHAAFSNDEVGRDRTYMASYDLLPGFETALLAVALVGAAWALRRKKD